MKRLAPLFAPLLLASIAAPVLAHSGHETHHALQEGLLHPITGLDHLLMLLGTGILAAITGRRLALPLATVAAMFIGAVLGRQLGAFGGMELVIVGSLIIAGVALLLPKRQIILAALMPVLALAHGWAHGVEAAPAGFWQFIIGFVIASIGILAAGYGAGVLLRHHQRVRQLAGSGLVAFAAVALAG